ncbi:MAG: permease-like cell division protein FtsX [Cyclobacteriaceae bacterium]
MKERNTRKRKLGSYPFVSVIFSITLSLFVMGLFGLLFVLSQNLTTLIQENVEIQVYLDKSIISNEVTRIQKTVGSKPYVNNKEGIESIVWITQEEAAQQFVSDTGEDFTNFLGDNPLRDLLVIKIDPGYQSVDSLSLIKSEVEAIRGVYEVSYAETLVESINRNLAKIGAILVGFALILLIVVAILINNTIKLALFSQRFLIRSMQLVGATSTFIRRPFLSRAVMYGLISGMLASGILFFLLQYANNYVQDLEILTTDQHLVILFSVLIVLGILVAFLSTYRSVRRYLSISLDELY